MTTPSLREDILRFKYSINRDSYPPISASTFTDPSIGKLFNDDTNDDSNASLFSNRGNKLMYNSDSVDLTKMTSKREDLKTIEITEVLPDKQTTRQRLIITNKILDFNAKLKEELDQEFGALEDDEENDYYYDDDEDIVMDDDSGNILTALNIAKILSPITHPSDIVTRSSLSSIYQSNHLSNLAADTIDIIQKEQDNVNQLSKLMNVFLGDDATDLLEANLKLPDYDHHLDLNKKINESEDAIQQIINGNGNGDAMSNGNAQIKTQNGKKEESNDTDSNNLNEGEFEDRRITRAQSIDQAVNNGTEQSMNPNELIKDPFFQLPQYVKDFNYGITKPEDAEESRQLIQIALQRNEEFIRSLTNIRNGFIRADRLKNNVYKWCREINEEKEREKGREKDREREREREKERDRETDQRV